MAENKMAVGPDRSCAASKTTEGALPALQQVRPGVLVDGTPCASVRFHFPRLLVSGELSG